MKFIPQDIEGVWLIKPQVFTDGRGSFAETFKEKVFFQNVGTIHFIQENESFSVKNVLRGLHFQKGIHSQSKLIRVMKGEILDVVVDLRKSSPTFGKHIKRHLSYNNGEQLFVPKGFAHGFFVLSDETIIQYKIDEPYCPASEVTLKWDDPAVDIDWELNHDHSPIVSEKDAKGLSFQEIPLFF